LNYRELAIKIMFPFCSDFINESELKNIIEKSYSKFGENDVVKITDIGNHKLLELFHGPTLAFKDIAMQFIGNLYDFYIKNNNQNINIIVATSGDTGAAAIDAIKGKKNMNIFVLHPNNKISKIQRKLMTTVKDKNVFNIAIEGNFDDCQNLVKSMFEDLDFSKSIKMSGVNSINWARIIAQSVYYFYCYLKLDKKKSINFSVPTGNFGDVYAGYLSKKMGLPIGKLIVATNQNDILHRAISSGKYIANQVQHTISPSMDIQVASNFERLIYDINDCNADKTNKIMQGIKNEREYLIEEKELRKIKLPKFEKARDDRLKKKYWHSLKKKPEIVILEGWCVGAKPQSNSLIRKPINILEKYEDKDLIWRKHVNEKLKKEYRKLFAMIDYFIFMKIPNFNMVFKWRLLQENKLKKKSHLRKKVMSHNEIKRFIMFYQRITLQMMKDLSKSASIVIFLKINHEIKKMLFRS